MCPIRYQVLCTFSSYHVNPQLTSDGTESDSHSSNCNCFAMVSSCLPFEDRKPKSCMLCWGCMLRRSCMPCWGCMLRRSCIPWSTEPRSDLLLYELSRRLPGESMRRSWEFLSRFRSDTSLCGELAKSSWCRLILLFRRGSLGNMLRTTSSWKRGIQYRSCHSEIPIWWNIEKRSVLRLIRKKVFFLNYWRVLNHAINLKV